MRGRNVQTIIAILTIAILGLMMILMVRTLAVRDQVFRDLDEIRDSLAGESNSLGRVFHATSQVLTYASGRLEADQIELARAVISHATIVRPISTERLRSRLRDDPLNAVSQLATVQVAYDEQFADLARRYKALLSSRSAEDLAGAFGGFTDGCVEFEDTVYRRNMLIGQITAEYNAATTVAIDRSVRTVRNFTVFASSLLLLLSIISALYVRSLNARRADIQRTSDQLQTMVEARTADLNSTVNELQFALDQVKTLKGLIPICAHCKKVRDDDGYWNRIEEYVTARSDADFSHGICPDCMAELYPEMQSDSSKGDAEKR